MKTTTTEALESVRTHQPTTDERVARRVEPGMVFQQGDVYLTVVDTDWPRGEELGTRQVAVGDTKGSRHVADGDGVRVYAGKQLPLGFKCPQWVTDQGIDPIALFLGPVVVADGPWSLTHPEHADHVLPPCVVQVTYQADFLRAARVAD